MDWRKLNWLATLLLLSVANVDGFIGIFWGRSATQSMVPSQVVDLLLQNEISDIRLYAPSPNVLVALQDSSLRIAVTLPNDFIQREKWTNNVKSIHDWVKELIVVPVKKRRINIKTLVILDEPFSTYHDNESVLTSNATNIFRETLATLKDQNLTEIRTTTAHLTDVLKKVNKPSEADFNDVIKDIMLEYLNLFNTSNSFFTINMHPFVLAHENNWPIEFAFMDNKSNFTIVDGKYTYTNAFEFIFDALVVAIEKAGYPNMEIIVGQIGWPTDGAKEATLKNAERFYRGFLKHIAQEKGTPRRPNQNINVYLATLADENKIPLVMGTYQRHRGIYNFDGTPKFKIDLSGQGRDIYPVAAKGIMKMPSRWCMLNTNTSEAMNTAKVKEQMEGACNITDCTSLSPGSTCSNLNYTWKVSYAFNMYYQTFNQEAGACDFKGLGVLTPFDPSVGNCIFPVEILTAETVDGGYQLLNYVGYKNINGGVRSRYFMTFKLSIGLPLFCTLYVLSKHSSCKTLAC